MSDMAALNGKTNKDFADGFKLPMEAIEAIMTQYGLINNSVGSGEFDAQIDNLYNRFEGATAANIVKGVGKASVLYQAADNAAKAHALIQEIHKWRRASPKGTSMSTIIEKAAKDTIATTQNYDRVFTWVRTLSQWGLGVPSFVSFSSELVRNSANNVTLAAKELSSGNPVLMANGAKRLAGMAVTYGMVHAMHAMYNGMRSDEEDSMLRSVLPNWHKDSELLISQVDEDGIMTVTDSQYMIPQAYFTEIVKTGLRGGSAIDALKQAFDPFNPLTNTNIATLAVVQAVQPVVAKATGGDGILWDWDVDTGTEAVGKIGMNFLKKMAKPGLWKSGEKWHKAETGEVTFGGTVHQKLDLAKSLGGFRPAHTDTRSEEFSGGLFSATKKADKDLKKITSKYRLEAKDDAGKAADIARADERREEVAKDFRLKIKFLSTPSPKGAGLDSSTIYTRMKDAEIPKWLRLEAYSALKD